MAFVRTLDWGAVTEDIINAAFAHVGGTISTLHASWGAAYGNVNGWNIYIGEGTTNKIGHFMIGGSSTTFWYLASANSSIGAGGNCTRGSNTIRIVATKSAVSFTNIDTNGVSKAGVLFTTDNKGDLCSVVTSSNTATLDTPAIVPRSESYVSVITYNAQTSTSFGTTALSLIPVPTFDDDARYLPNVAFAHSAQMITDGTATFNGSKWYVVGGSWLMKDPDETAA